MPIARRNSAKHKNNTPLQRQSGRKHKPLARATTLVVAKVTFKGEGDEACEFQLFSHLDPPKTIRCSVSHFFKNHAKKPHWPHSILKKTDSTPTQSTSKSVPLPTNVNSSLRLCRPSPRLPSLPQKTPLPPARRRSLRPVCKRNHTKCS
jgi:hypothetical protein